MQQPPRDYPLDKDGDAIQEPSTKTATGTTNNNPAKTDLTMGELLKMAEEDELITDDMIREACNKIARKQHIC